VAGLTPEEQSIVERARLLGIAEAEPVPAYWSPALCTALSFLLAPPTLGYSLIVVPLIWVTQHEHTRARLATLRARLLPSAAPSPEAGEPGEGTLQQLRPSSSS